uniref:Uncharacterized protein n=1 Tax=viral metagenome TaxID=1070528 RepID=A0A6C0B3K6_9ZZZZ
MPHKRFTPKTKDFYKIKILSNIEFNGECCPVAELEGYSRKELKIIASRIKPDYNNIDKRDLYLYKCLY